MAEFAEGLETLDRLRDMADFEHLNTLLAREVSPAVRVGGVDRFGDGPSDVGFLIDTSRLSSEQCTRNGMRRFLTSLAEACETLHHGAGVHMALRVNGDYIWTLPPEPGGALDELIDWFLEALDDD